MNFIFVFITPGLVSDTSNRAELSVSLCQTLYLCEIEAHTRVGSNVPLKSCTLINN